MVIPRSSGLIRALLCLSFWVPSTAVTDEVYQEPAAFLEEVFDGDIPAVRRLWITSELVQPVREILGHDLGQLRQRYWRRGERSAWILEEIGKDQPITTGVVIEAGRVAELRVLIYRESRGWEVRYPAFTEQFRGAALTERRALDRPVNGITGATLSVRALTRLARVALLLAEHLPSE